MDRNQFNRPWSRRKVCLAAAAVGASAAVMPVRAQSRLPRLVLAGPFAAVSNPLIRMVDSGALADVAQQVEFLPWKDPDQLRALALGGKADFIAMPSNVAANLHNRGVPLQLLNISTWGVLWMVSRQDGLKTLADFRGKEVLMPFRSDMPDIVFRLLAEKQGLNVDKDVKLRYVASPLDAMQLLITRRADHALLAEPAVSVGLRKSRSFPVRAIAPDLYRSVNLQQEWGRLFGRKPRIPQAGITVMGQHRGNALLLARFQKAYAEALSWCEGHAQACGKLVASKIDMLTPEGVADSVVADNAVFVTAAEARPELEFFFARLHERQPGLIGGKLPAASFYYGAV